MSPGNKGRDEARMPIQLGCASKVAGEMLRLKSEFDHVRSNGNKLVGKYMLLVSSPSTKGIPRFGIICGKKYSRKAVLRNRARRLLRESFRLLKAGLLPTDVVVIARRAMAEAGVQEVQKDMIHLLRKAGVFSGKDADY
ncbi:MAG: ribonuclease P protein component [Victivallales bacterium]|nr:ribonuclease P protein component [Victivallales bacterium]